MGARLFIVFCFYVYALVAPAGAQTLSDADKSAFQSIITQQIEAFRVGDNSKAYSFASPRVQSKFRNAAIFGQMARKGYAPVTAPERYQFGRVSDELGGPTQHVDLTGPAGKSWVALYGFERQSDNTWRISGVVLIKVPGADT